MLRLMVILGMAFAVTSCGPETVTVQNGRVYVPGGITVPVDLLGCGGERLRIPDGTLTKKKVAEFIAEAYRVDGKKTGCLQRWEALAKSYNTSLADIRARLNGPSER